MGRCSKNPSSEDWLGSISRTDFSLSGFNVRGVYRKPDRLKPVLNRDLQQLTHGAAKDGDALGVAQAGLRHHVIHGGVRPRKGIVRSQTDLARADHCDQVPQGLWI